MRSATEKHTITLTRQLQAEAAEVFGNSNQFDIRVQQVGAKQYFDLIWGNRWTAQFKSRKDAHEWVRGQIALGRA